MTYNVKVGDLGGKHMLKKALVIIISIFTLFVFIGCNGDGTIDTTNLPTTIEITQEPTTEAPTEVPTQEPTTEDVTTEEVTSEVPTEEPTTDKITTEEPTTIQPTETPTEEPTTEETTTEEPTTEEPTTEVPTTEEPTTEEPTTEEPTTEEPTTTEEVTTQNPITQLFFSEYGEGSSFNKYVEIFNGTGQAVDLSNYSIQLYSNGAASPSQTLTLSGTLDPNDVLVVAHPTANATILTQADITNSSVINFNGNYPLTLSYNGTIIDSLGMPGDASNYGQDTILVRKDSITGPSINFSMTQWDQYPNETYDYIGSHSNFIPDNSILLEQDYNQLPDTIDLIGDWNFGSGSNGSTYTIINVTGLASEHVIYNANYIESTLLENVQYEGEIHIEVSLEGAGTLTKIVGLTLKFSTLDLSTHPEYYESIGEELSGETLLLALRSLINNGFVGVDYGAATTILAESDADPNNAENIILVYLQTSIDGSWDSGATWNREHIWPQSYLGDTADNNTVNIASDLHNLKPANPSENSSRGNKYFDNITTSSTYEPADEVKGDIARILFYMIVMYDYLELIDDPNGSAVYDMGVFSTLLEWHILDPVSDFELNRNNVIYSYQFNRNPFIDNPQYVELIWGNN